jgi:hypothetical protein
MNEESTRRRARTVLRKYLTRCHKTVSANYPEIADMPPEKAANYLIHLRDTGRITITLDTVGSQIECQIEDVDGPKQQPGTITQLGKSEEYSDKQASRARPGYSG